MRIPVYKQVWSWSAVALVLVLVLWGLGGVLTPFLIGAGIAYILDPVADRLEASGLSRTKSVALITIIAALAFALGLVLVVPMLVRQVGQLIEHTPQYIETAQGWITARYPEFLPEGGSMRNTLTRVAQQFSDQGGQIMVTVLSSITNIIGVVLLLFIVPVVTFYLLLDWDAMVARIDTLLPREHAQTIRGIAREVNDSMSGFLRGQGLVTLILATFYSSALLAVGLPFALVIGIGAAVLSIIPYVGVFTGGVTSVAVAALTFWDDPKWIVAVLAIFVVGQIIEGNYLQPKIIGGHVGLHPVWLMIALAVFGKLFGFVGLVVAVPLGAIIGVLVRFFVDRYKESALYTGREVLPEPAPPVLIEVVPPGTTAEARRRSQHAHAAAVAEVKIEEARFVAREAAAEAARKDGASVAVAEVVVAAAGAHGSVDQLEMEPAVRTWGGKTPDGTDPDDPDGSNAAKKAREDAEAAAEAASERSAFLSDPAEGDPEGNGRMAPPPGVPSGAAAASPAPQPSVIPGRDE